MLSCWSSKYFAGIETLTNENYIFSTSNTRIVMQIIVCFVLLFIYLVLYHDNLN